MQVPFWIAILGMVVVGSIGFIAVKEERRRADQLRKDDLKIRRRDQFERERGKKIGICRQEKSQ